MHNQHGGKPFEVEAPTRATFAQLAPSQNAEPRDYWIFDSDRGPDCKIACSVKGFLPDLCYEGFLERDREEGGRCIVAHPEREAGIADVDLAVRDGARLNAVTLGPAPVLSKALPSWITTIT
jgi:hypothetical protein